MDKESRKLKREIRKSENSLFRLIFKLGFMIFALVLQLAIFYGLYVATDTLHNSMFFVYNIFRIISIVYLLYQHDSANYKLSWVLFIMFMPVFGIVVYSLWGNSRLRRRKKIETMDIEHKTNYLLDNSFDIDREIMAKDRHVYNMLKYTQNVTSYTVCKNISCKYYNLGDKVFVDLKKDLLNAQKFIFMEFYIIDKGEISQEIFNILKKKAKEGLDVKLIYDSYGCLMKFNKKMKEELENAGVKIYAFNPPSIFINMYFNNRLHRKIVSIDGKISYTGGMNLADEYANIKEMYGHWKDAGIRFEGEISWNFTLMFLRDLNLISKKEKIDYDYYKKISSENVAMLDDSEAKGIAVALADGPNNRKNPVETLYMQTINTATDYVYITTPYFAISEEMLASLLNSARSGVDVRIILPHIPDKKIVQLCTRSFYEVLLSSGVRVYEYKPGFIHSKTFISDDKLAIVGSANMDYRSMNLNYECISLIFDTGKEIDVKKDFENMIANSCIEVNLKDWIKRPLITKIIEALFTTFSTMF